MAGVAGPGEWVKRDLVWCLPISHYVVDDGEIVVDTMIRYESLQPGLDIVCDHLGITRVALAQSNRSSHTHYSEYYDQESKEMVAELFREDIERFGFDFTGEPDKLAL